MFSNDPRLRKKVYIAAGLLIVATVVGFLFHSEDMVNTSEVVKGMGDKKFQLHCNACNETVDVSAAEYMELYQDFKYDGAPGLKCPKCGALAAWQIGVARAAFDPAALKGLDLSTVEAVEDAMHATDLDLNNAKDALAAAESAGDNSKIEEARAKLHAVEAKLVYLNDVWDKRAMERQGGR